jgi:hypothetical protein
LAFIARSDVVYTFAGFWELRDYRGIIESQLIADFTVDLPDFLGGNQSVIVTNPNFPSGGYSPLCSVEGTGDYSPYGTKCEYLALYPGNDDLSVSIFGCYSYFYNCPPNYLQDIFNITLPVPFETFGTFGSNAPLEGMPGSDTLSITEVTNPEPSTFVLISPLVPFLMWLRRGSSHRGNSILCKAALPIPRTRGRSAQKCDRCL